MKLLQIEALNFRNYKKLIIDLKDDIKINILNAPNGMGKTNIIELIFFLSYYRSFRNVTQKELINVDSEQAFIKCSYINRESIINNKTIKIDKNKKEIINNNKKIYKLSESFADITSVLFSNSDNNLIIGNLNIRRKFFDMFISIIDKNYLYFLKKYYILLRHKNFILKNRKNLELLDIYDNQLSNIILYIKNKKLEIINSINEIFSEKYQEIGDFNQRVYLFYDSKFKDYNKNEIYNFLKKNRDKDIKLGYSFYGTHKDNYFFLMNDKTFEKIASLGQIRLAALILKLIQSYYISKTFKESPIILVDDVIIELDSKRQKNFIKEILFYDQLFITISDDKYLLLFKDIYESKNIIELDYGKIKRIFSY